MKTYPHNFEQKTGFDEIRRLLTDYCNSPLGIHFVTSLSFSDDYNWILNQLDQADEMILILSNESAFPSQDYFDLTDEMSRLRPAGTFFDPARLPEFRASLTALTRVMDFFNLRDDDKYPVLRNLTAPVHLEPEILKRLNRLLDDKGNIRDDASEELFRIRKEIRQKQVLAEKRIQEILLTSKKSGLTADDAEIALRNGRMVIPVPASQKRKLRGFVHDVSATGLTAYIEPDEVFEINNDVAELHGLEKREIIRILTLFTDFVRPFFEELRDAYRYLGNIDFIRAKARLALRIHGVKPVLLNSPGIQWRNAVHPLLFLHLEAQKKEVVPLDLKLDIHQRILIISGPNAGGKSVCLRTAGLLQYMLQCGIPIPVKPDSEAGIFSQILLDIGDEQSIENDLSTYSSHLLNMRIFLENAASRTLFLIDEMGSGTEPRTGGAIAEAVIEKLSHSKAFGVITTHYANLKLLEGRISGVFNGAMLFDIRQMKPLYRLSMGKPGSSFAFEIARQMGLPRDVLASATQKTGETQLSFDQQLQQLELEKEELERKRKEFDLADELLTKALQRYQDLYNQLESNKKEILKQAKLEASDLLKQTHRLIENTILEIRKTQAEKETTRELRRKIKSEESVLQEQAENLQPQSLQLIKNNTPAPETHRVKATPPQPGDTVRIKKLDAFGELESLSGEDAIVIFNSMRLTIQASQIEKAEENRIKPIRTGNRRLTDEINEKLSAFRLTIDVRGTRGDEALARVDHYIDEAILLSIKEVRILHGKGNGILRTLVREHLARQKAVAAYDDESQEAGGSGVTVVRLK